MQAVILNNKPALLFLLETTPKIDIDARNERGKTALFLAIYYIRNDLVEILLKAGANPNIPNDFGWTPLMQARFQHNYYAIDRLLAANADTNIKNFKGETIYEMNFCDSPLITPILFNKVAVLKNLLSKSEPASYERVLLMTIQLKKHHCLEILLMKKPNLEENNYLGKALLNDDFTSFDLLLKAGANPNRVDECGSLLHTAVMLKQHKFLIALLENGANVDVMDKLGETPLMLAIKKKDAISIKALAEKKPDLGLKNGIGESAFSLIEENQEWVKNKNTMPGQNYLSFFKNNLQTISFSTGAFCAGALLYHLARRGR
jgi:ankyrin repeat protein